jgi:hypothetical protein
MAHLTIHVPKAHVDDLRRELLRAHAARVQQLRRMLDAYVDTQQLLDDVEGVIVEIRDFHDVIEQLGWSPTKRPVARAVIGHPEVLADVIDRLVANTPADEDLLDLERQIGTVR